MAHYKIKSEELTQVYNTLANIEPDLFKSIKVIESLKKIKETKEEKITRLASEMEDIKKQLNELG